MGGESKPGNRSFSELSVDTVTREDGRYLLYYSWPEQPHVESNAADGHDSSAADPQAADQRAWNPEAGPPADDGDV